MGEDCGLVCPHLNGWVTSLQGAARPEEPPPRDGDCGVIAPLKNCAQVQQGHGGMGGAAPVPSTTHPDTWTEPLTQTHGRQREGTVVGRHFLHGEQSIHGDKPLPHAPVNCS